MDNHIKSGTGINLACPQSVRSEDDGEMSPVGVSTTRSAESSRDESLRGRSLPTPAQMLMMRASGNDALRRSLLEQCATGQMTSATSVESDTANADLVPKIVVINLVQQSVDCNGYIGISDFVNQMKRVRDYGNFSEPLQEGERLVRQRTESSGSTQSTAAERYLRFAETSTVERGVPEFNIENVKTLSLWSGTKKEWLGSGSFATTYLVQVEDGAQIDPDCVDDKFAFKELRNGNEQNTLLAELRSSFSLENVPGLMKVYGVYKIENKPGILCEYIDGKNSDKFFDDARQALASGAIGANDFFNLIKHAFSDLMTALAGLEKRKLTHNDIAPDNLMFSFRTNQLIAVDFGLVKEYEQPTNIGKVPYMPPENMRGNQTANPKIDPFCAGQVLHSWIYGGPFNWANFTTNDITACIFSAGVAAERFSNNQIRFDPDNINTYGPNDAALFADKNAVPQEITDLLGALLSGAPDERLSAMAAIGGESEGDPARQAFFQVRKGPNTIKMICEKVKTFSLQNGSD